MTLEEPQPSSSSSSSSSSSRMDQSVPSSRTFRLGRVQPQAPGHRTIFCNDRLANLPVRLTGNSISTTKYNVFTFLPKGLFEQFRRVANIYFLTISVLSTTPISFELWKCGHMLLEMAALAVVMPLRALERPLRCGRNCGCRPQIKTSLEAFEDWKRFQNDMAINNGTIDVLRDREWVSIPWKKLQVGDLVKVKSG